jgi:protein-L-isoaspartate O-methyltransferase
MTEQLDPEPTDRVLEIGTGSRYQAAVLSRLVAEVYTIEIIEPLAKHAEADLKRLGYLNVKVLAGGTSQVADSKAKRMTWTNDRRGESHARGASRIAISQ